MVVTDTRPRLLVHKEMGFPVVLPFLVPPIPLKKYVELILVCPQDDWEQKIEQ